MLIKKLVKFGLFHDSCCTNFESMNGRLYSWERFPSYFAKIFSSTQFKINSYMAESLGEYGKTFVINQTYLTAMALC